MLLAPAFEKEPTAVLKLPPKVPAEGGLPIAVSLMPVLKRAPVPCSRSVRLIAPIQGKKEVPAMRTQSGFGRGFLSMKVFLEARILLLGWQRRRRSRGGSVTRRGISRGRTLTLGTCLHTTSSLVFRIGAWQNL